MYLVRFAVGPKLLNFILAITFAALLSYAAMLTIPVDYTAPSIGLDASWAFGLNYISAGNLKFGTDVIFTYGPLGYIAMPHNVGTNLGSAIALRLLVWVAVIWQLIAIYRNGGFERVHSVVFTAAIIAANKVLFALPEYLFLALLLLLVHRLFNRPERMRELALLVAIVSFLSLFKFSAYIAGLAVATIYVGWRLLSAQGRLQRREVVLLALAVAGGPLAYLMYEPSWTSLKTYFNGGMQFAVGYSEAMSLPTPARAAFFFFVLTAILGASFFYAIAKRIIAMAPALIAAALYFLAFKHGFVRSDDGHLVPFYAFSVVVFGYLICQIRLGLWQAAAYGLAFAAFVIVAMTAIGPVPAGHASWWSPRHAWQRMSLLRDWNEISRQLDIIGRQAVDLNRLKPTYLPVISGKRVTILPYELSYAATGQVHLEPLYVIQSYAAYTNWLDVRTAGRLRERKHLTDYVLLEWKTVDTRHPAFDTPATWAALYEQYQPVLHTETDLLLAPRGEPATSDLQKIMTATMEPGSWVDIPRSHNAVAATISMPLTVRGRLLRAGYKVGFVYIHCETESGLHFRFRVPPDVLQFPFVINTIATDATSLWEFWRHGRSGDRVVRVKLDGDGIGMFRTPVITFLEDHARPLNFLAHDDVKLSQHIHVSSPDQIAANLVGHIDAVGGAPWVATKPTTVLAGKGLEISGWLSTNEKDGSVVDDVFAIARGSRVKCSVIDRPDVAAFLKNPRLERSGFRVYIPAGKLAPGKDWIYLIGYSKREDKFYKYPAPVLIHVIQ